MKKKETILTRCLTTNTHMREHGALAEASGQSPVFILDKTCSYKWCSSHLNFSCINGPKLCDWVTGLHVGCIRTAAGVSCSCEQQWLGHRWSHAVLQWLGQRDNENKETLQQCMGLNSWQLAWHSDGHIGRVDTVGGLQQWSGHPVPQLKLQWPGQPTASWNSGTL